MLTSLQSQAFDAATKNYSNIFVTGPGGVGKSTVVRRIIDHQRRAGFVVTVTATTGVASLIVGGLTLHSELGIGLGRDDVCDLINGIVSRRKVDVWRKTDLLVIDEISMLTAKLFDKLESIARKLRHCQKPFGGIRLLLSGDFLQLPCINGEFCFDATCWSSLALNVFHLTEVKRQLDPIFQQCLARARVGAVTDEDIALLTANGGDDGSGAADGIRPTKILCKNIDVDHINMMEVKKIGAPIFKYNWKVNVLSKEHIGYASFDASKYCNCQSELFICVGAQVMLLINQCHQSGLVNGSRGIVCGIENKIPLVKFTNGITRPIDWCIWNVKKNDILLATIKQIPLKLAYAITAHKSQGCTIDSAYIDLVDTFEYGQAYVALSRVKCLDRLILCNATKKAFKANPKAVAYYNSLVQ